MHKLRRAHAELSVELRREPADEEIAQRLGWSVKEVLGVKTVTPDTTSLDQLVSTETAGTQLIDYIVDEKALDTQETVIKETEMIQLREAIGRLPERVRRLLVRRYGLDDREPPTLAELGQELGNCRERVRQLQHQAESILRNGDRQKGTA